MTPFDAFKRLAASLVAVTSLSLGLGTPLLAAGTTPLSLVPQFDSAGNIAPGCLLNFYVAGTVATPQNAFADFGLTTPLPNPLQCDQAGRVPLHWLADGLIHIRLTTAAGSPIVDTTMQVLGPSSGGGGGGGTVDPTAILATGDLKPRYGTGPISGFIRLNGLTIGNAVSGATERANADTQAAFVYLYGVDANLVVSGGRSGNALNDFNANKTITTPDWRGRALAALDDMGNSAAGRLTAAFFGTAATVLGAAGGSQSQTLSQANLPSATLAVAITDPGHFHNVTTNSAAGVGFVATTGQGSVGSTPTTTAFTGISATAQLGGSNTPHAIASPMMLATIYMKL